MINLIKDYLINFFMVQFFIMPLFIIFFFWTKKYTDFKIQNLFLHSLVFCSLLLPLLFLIPLTGLSPGQADNKLYANQLIGLLRTGSGAISGNQKKSPLSQKVIPAHEVKKNQPQEKKQIILPHLVKGYDFSRKILLKFSSLLLAGLGLGLILLIRMVFIHFNLMYRIKKEPFVSELINNGKKYRIYRSHHVPVPFTNGVIFPAIYLPDYLTQAEERIIIRHEMVHIDHHHILWVWFYQIYSILFWYYPMARYLKNSNIRFQELFTDDQSVTAHNSQFYMKTLLKCSEHSLRLNQPPLFTAAAVRKTHFEERIKRIISHPVVMPNLFSKSIILITSMINLLLIAGLISCSRDKDRLPSYSQLKQAKQQTLSIKEQEKEGNKKIKQFFMQFKSDIAGPDSASVIQVRSEKKDYYYVSSDFTKLKPMLTAKNRSKLPLTWPLLEKNSPISLPFGKAKKIPGLYAHNWFHTGIDIAAARGTSILATADGIIYQTGYEPDSLGNYVIIYHDFGISTIYTHLQAITVQQGQSVRQGEKIGLLGNSGRSTGPHLHYAISVTPVSIEKHAIESAVYVDPMQLLTITGSD